MKFKSKAVCFLLIVFFCSCSTTVRTSYNRTPQSSGKLYYYHGSFSVVPLLLVERLGGSIRTDFMVDTGDKMALIISDHDTKERVAVLPLDNEYLTPERNFYFITTKKLSRFDIAFEEDDLIWDDNYLIDQSLTFESAEENIATMIIHGRRMEGGECFAGDVGDTMARLEDIAKFNKKVAEIFQKCIAFEIEMTRSEYTK